MTIAAILAYILKFGPLALQSLPVLQKLYGDIKAGFGDKEATPEDWAELNQLYVQAGADIYARHGIQPPPPAPADDYLRALGDGPPKPPSSGVLIGTGP